MALTRRGPIGAVDSRQRSEGWRADVLVALGCEDTGKLSQGVAIEVGYAIACGVRVILATPFQLRPWCELAGVTTIDNEHMIGPAL